VSGSRENGEAHILTLVIHRNTAQQTAWNDAYNLATAYFLTHRYAQAEHLLCTPLRLARREVPVTKEEDVAFEDGEDAPRHLDLDWEDEDAAVAATRQNSSLPPSMLAKMGGVNTMNGEDNGDISVARKRKERPFTISGNGTGSEGGGEQTSGESASNHEEVGAGKSIGDQVMQAWKEEQRVAMEEVRERELLPPDSVSLVSISIPCKYLAAQCMVRQEKYQEALDELSGWKNESKDDIEESYRQPSKDGLIKLSSSIWHLKGLIHLKLRNTEEAKEDFIKSLSLDVKNYESFDQLIRGNLLTSSEQWSLIEGLHFVNQSGNDPVQLEALQLVQMVYTTRLDKTGKLHAQQAAAARRQLIRVYGLDNNADVLLGLAEEMFARMKYEDAYTVTKRIMEISKDHEASLAIYISTMYMIPRLRPTLFLVAHHLTEMDPDLPAAWYAVGCWYLGTKQWLEARKYFSKCVQMDPRFAPGWIAFAHTFSYEGESDQAIVSYSTAERLFTSNHLIKLFVGMEHLNQANLTLAEIYLQGSAVLWEEDALSRNERGVVQYYRGNIKEAIILFESALEAAKDVQQPAEAWSATRLNLGFAYRRIRQTEKAIRCFLQVVELDPDSSAAYLGLGMCYHRLGDLDEAILWYHRSLAITTNDKQTSELLSLALEESAKVVDLLLPSQILERKGSVTASATPVDSTSRAEWIDRSLNQTATTVTMDEGNFSASTQMDESL
jgi:anaphase-promoting complex subunit 6